MSVWLLDEPIQASIDEARAAGTIISAEQIAQINIECAADVPTVKGRKAIIPINGILTNKRDFLAAVFGGGNTLYPDIINAVQKADADPQINETVLAVGATPGGTIAGLFPAMEAIRNSSTPVTAVVEDMALSAGYGLVSQAREIVAMTPVTQLGNVGIVRSYSVDESVIDVTSTKAPKKRNDVTTEEGLAAAREVLDDVHDEFAKAIAIGRGTTADNVNKNYGQGATVIAKKALKAGMITSIFQKQQTDETASQGGEEVTAMNLEEFKAAHPALYAEAVAIGQMTERNRVEQHAKLGEKGGDQGMAIAMKAIKEGTDVESLQSDYIIALTTALSINSRQNENVKDLDSTVGPPAEAKSPVDLAYEALEARNNDSDSFDVDALRAELAAETAEV